ncbi:MAG TPA: SpoIIE family protein phosphatase [Gaiellaceae bacterium]|nr:SpoIIE family protein phosphatase [Gaiellaceae bacterium]
MAVDLERLPVEILAQAAARVASAAGLRDALADLAQAAVAATGADVAVLRVRDDDGSLVARGIAPEGSGLAAEAAGGRSPLERAAAGRPSEALARIAERARAADVLVAPAEAGGQVVGAVELVRLAEPFDAAASPAAALVAAQLALAIRTIAPGLPAAAGGRRSRVLELTGDALAAGGDTSRAARQALRAAVEATGARGGAVWRLHGEQPELLASEGPVRDALARAAEIAAQVAGAWRPVAVEPDPRLPADAGCAVTLPLGEPAFGALQLFYRDGSAPPEAELRALAGFAGRTAHALRSGERIAGLALELDRTRALLELVGDAISQLSLAHTLETGVERTSQLLGIEHVAVYLSDEGRLRPAAGAGHAEVAERLDEASRGPLRARALLHATARGGERALAGVRAALRAAREPSAVAVPLRVRGETIGLLVAYPGARDLSASDEALLVALGAQFAVAVQNARLHERATDLGEALAEALRAERQASRQVAALYEISRSFTQTLSLQATLDAVTETLVRELEVDAAVIRVADERGDLFVPRSVHVAESRLAPALRAILDRPERRPPRSSGPRLLDLGSAGRAGGAHRLLRPFLEKGSTAALLPIATPSELLAELTILSLDPAAPIGSETLAAARTIARQAALAIDNARLYQQQKRFAETMQRSLLPRELPAIAGLDVGGVYESAAQVDVGGDVYDFLELADGRLAVVLGDVTGHGIDATADMAMAKFTFRSLARKHAEPAAFLAAANDVVVDEIAPGKFITMVYLTVAPDGTVRCASAGHPPPRVVQPGGAVSPIECGGLALGIDASQSYGEARTVLEAGAAVVLYTDGVLECRRGAELFGQERLDALLAGLAGRPAQEAADAVLDACRAFAGGDLPDDCAVVVIRRAPV